MSVRGIRPVSEWKKLLAEKDGLLQQRMAAMYGGPEYMERPMQLLGRCVDEFVRQYGEDGNAFIVRSTGRVNLLGMHVDHRGGAVNPVAIKEAFFVVQPREDDTVVARDIRGDVYPPESFVISQCLPEGKKIEDWDSWCHDELEKRKGDSSITFSSYVRAGVLYFQHLNTADDGTRSPAFRGMNIIIGSNVPPAAGLSTSSCLTVASAKAALNLNGIEMDPYEFCEQCGFAEWYVGTRGGFGDHAAITLSRCNHIAHMTSYPFALELVPFPSEYQIVLADCLVEAKKQAGAKEGFNIPVASYEFGLWMLQKQNPEYAGKMERLRDVNPEALGVSEAEILRMIRGLPESATREQVLAMLPDKEKEVRNVFRSHTEPEGGYRIRQVCMYGISECMRSDLAADILRENDIEAFGRLITLHHEGDRVARLEAGRMVPVVKDYSDSRMDALIADAESGDPERIERSHIWAQPGGYNVSVPELDHLVDLSLQAEGVVGAGLVGAGLGGSMAAVVRNENAHALVERLAEDFYRPKGLPVKAEVVSAVDGAGILEV